MTVALLTGMASAETLDDLKSKGLTPETMGPAWEALSGEIRPKHLSFLYGSVTDSAARQRVYDAIQCLDRFAPKSELGPTDNFGQPKGKIVGDVLLEGRACLDDNNSAKNADIVRAAEVRSTKSNARDIAEAKQRFIGAPGGFIDGVLGGRSFAYWGAIRSGSIRNNPDGAAIMSEEASNYKAVEAALADVKANRWGCKLMTPDGQFTTDGLVYCLPASLWAHVIVRQARTANDHSALEETRRKIADRQTDRLAGKH